MATSRFPLANLPTAVMGAVSGSQAGSHAAVFFSNRSYRPVKERLGCVYRAVIPSGN